MNQHTSYNSIDNTNIDNITNNLDNKLNFKHKELLSKIQINFLLIGSDKVGKKSIVKRLSHLHSSETKQVKFNNEIPSTPKLKQMLKANKRIKDIFELKQIENKKLEERKICAFEKIFTLGKYYLSLRNVIIEKPQPILYTDSKEVIEELEENEKLFKIKFDNVKSHIKRILYDINEEDMNNTQVNHINSGNISNIDVLTNTQETNYIKNKDFSQRFYIFLFIYDLSQTDSLDKIMYFYNELNKTFNIDSNPNYDKVFIGNKVDNKLIYDEKEYNNTYFTDKNLFNIEISTGMYFSFEKLFKKIYSNLISTKQKDLLTDYYMSKMDSILFERRTFYKSPKHILSNKNIPGPKYDVDIYSVIKEREFKKAYSKKDKFNYKVFVNKTGPIFYVNKNETNINENEMKNLTKQDNNIYENYNKDNDFNSNLNKEIKDVPNSLLKNGYSLGVKPSKIKYRKTRKEKINEYMNDFNNIFSLENITSGQSQSNNQSNLYKLNSKSSKSIIGKGKNSKFNRASSSKINTVNQELVKLRRIEKEKKSLENLERLKKEKEDQYNEYLQKKDEYWRNRKEISESKPRINKVNVYPGLYNVTKGFIYENKQFTFGGKHSGESAFNKYDPELRKIETDFDYIVKHGTIR